MGRKYFYKDSNGAVQKYLYCSRCLNGPYVDTDKSVQIFEVASGSLCLKCMREIGLKGYEQLSSINKIENSKKIKPVPETSTEAEEPPPEEIVDIEPEEIVQEIQEPEPLPELKIPFKKSISKIKKPPIPKPEPKEEPSEKTPLVQLPDFANMSAREIVDMVFQKTGEKITVCIKSKANIIRHATQILSSKP